MVERSLRMREARGSIPRTSILLRCTQLQFCPSTTLLLLSPNTPTLTLLFPLYYFSQLPHSPTIRASVSQSHNGTSNVTAANLLDQQLFLRRRLADHRRQLFRV
ncbi:hypothetical protein HKD37_05G014224 [Glycine soja]